MLPTACRSLSHAAFGWLLGAVVVAAVAACGRAPSQPMPAAIRLVDEFTPDMLTGSTSSARAPAAPAEWRFDVAPVAEQRFPATRGVEAGPHVADLAVRDGLLVGRSTGDFPILQIERTTGLDSPDTLHAIEIRMRVSAGANMSVQTNAAERPPNLPEVQALGRRLTWPMTSPLQPGEEMHTYLVTPSQPVTGARIRRVLIRPVDQANATFTIESVRLIFRSEHLASVESGVSWQGLQDIYREALVARAPETLRFQLTLPPRPWLDLALGTVEDRPVTFRVAVERADGPTEAWHIDRTITTPHRWQPAAVELERFSGQPVTLSLSIASEEEGTLGIWGAPVIRSREVVPSSQRPRQSATLGARPKGVILIQADTLRRDHLDVYGHSRPTAPVLTRMAEEGVLFRNAISQASWTKVSTPSILTGLYPTTHGVQTLNDRLPAAATTIAEAYRAAGYATLSLSSIPFTGQYTNLHQGFEELHESASLPNRGGPLSSKTAREYVDRTIAWLEARPDTPFFIYLHVFDPHHPYEPYAPYNLLWLTAAEREEHLAQRAAASALIKDPFMKARSLPAHEEVVAAGLDPDRYVAREVAWYDGSIRAMDVEIGRLIERLDALGLGNDTLIVVTSDHGTEFFERGRFWHGQNVYAELTDVPLIAWWPGRLPGRRSVDEVVQTIDIVPTLIDVSELAPIEEVQGQSLLPFFGPEDGTGSWPRWLPRPAISERVPIESNPEPPRDKVCYAVTEGPWKLIHNQTPGYPEYELYDVVNDPLNRTDLAAQHPDVVARLAKILESWRQMATAARLRPDAETTEGLSPEQLNRLRSLGYIR
jgi:arylsulfatase A-like enzyme